MSTDVSPWTRTIAGQPRVGATAERARRTSMRDVEMFTEMTGDRTQFTTMPRWHPSLPSEG